MEKIKYKYLTLGFLWGLILSWIIVSLGVCFWVYCNPCQYPSPEEAISHALLLEVYFDWSTDPDKRQVMSDEFLDRIKAKVVDGFDNVDQTLLTFDTREWFLEIKRGEVE